VNFGTKPRSTRRFSANSFWRENVSRSNRNHWIGIGEFQNAGSQDLLQNVNIKQLSKLTAHFSHRSDVFVTGGLINVQAGITALRHPCDKRMIAKSARFVRNVTLQFSPNSSTAKFGLHIKGSLTGNVVGSAVRPRADATPTDQRSVDFGHNDGMSPSMLFKPTSSLPHRLTFRVERSGRCLNGLIINARDGRQIGINGSAQCYSGISLSIADRRPSQGTKLSPET
jgi:hypothetical protein